MEGIVGNSCIDQDNHQLLSTTVCTIWRGGNIICELPAHWGGGSVGCKLVKCRGGGGHHGQKKNGGGRWASARATEEDLPLSKIGTFLQRNHVEKI